MREQDYYLILYDMADDKRRAKLFGLLESFGAGFQFSVFEARLDARQMVRLRHGIGKIIDRDADRVAIVRLCEACRGKVEFQGRQQSVICKNVIVV